MQNSTMHMFILYNFQEDMEKDHMITIKAIRSTYWPVRDY